jgi:hypothetical protein
MSMPTAPDPADQCPCIRSADLPARVAERLLPLETIHTGFLDIEANGTVLTDRRLIVWRRDGAPTSLLLDEADVVCHVLGGFATLVISTRNAGGHYTRLVRAEHIHPLAELVRAFESRDRAQL